MNPMMREKLADLRQRKSAARERLAAARQEKQRALDRMPDGVPDMASEDWRAAERATQAIQKIESDVSLLDEEERFYLQHVAGIDDGILGGESFLRDPDVLRNLTQMATSKMPFGNLNLGPAMSRDEFIARIDSRRRLAQDGTGFDYTGTAGRTDIFRGIVPQLRRQLTLLDLIPTAGMDNNVIPYVQESGSFDTAAETAELAVKPEGEQILTDAEARARTIAHWIKLPRQTLSDVAGLATAVNTRLIYGVQRRLENQLIAGDGTGENILGILNTTGIASVAYNADALGADQALSGIVDVLLSDAQPSGVVLNPVDWQAMLTAKASGTGAYLSMGPFIDTPRQLWGLPVVTNKAMPQGKALVGDFALGATVFVREAPNIRLSDSDQDDFVRNRLTALGKGGSPSRSGSPEPLRRSSSRPPDQVWATVDSLPSHRSQPAPGLGRMARSPCCASSAPPPTPMLVDPFHPVLADARDCPSCGEVLDASRQHAPIALRTCARCRLLFPVIRLGQTICCICTAMPRT